MGQSSFLQDDQEKPAADDKGHLQREEALRRRINEGLAYEIAASRKRAAPETCFTYAAADRAFTGLASNSPNVFYAVPKIFQGRTASEQMVALADRTGPLLSGEQVSLGAIHEGMIIGIASRGGDAGVGDVQRTGIVFRDPKTHKLMFTESNAQGKLEQRPLEQLLADAKANNKNLFAGDLVKLAETMGARPEKNYRPGRTTHHSKFGDAPAPGAAPETNEIAALRHQISCGIEAMAAEAIHLGTRYHMGSNNTKLIDCSNFVGKAADHGFANLLQGKKAGKAAPGVAHGVSENQIENISQQTGFLLENDAVNRANLREGMVIGIDTGKHSWDKGRKRGIDHIVAVYRDSKTGDLMVAESTGCKDAHTGHSGPRTMPLDNWLNRAHRIWGQKLKLFATDLALLADKMGYETAESHAPPAKRADAPRISAG
jgi:hypothetical protein